jgi:hypothetical protein
MQNLKYSILETDLGNAERTYSAVAQMAERQGGNLVPVAGEVRRNSSYLKKIEKNFQINIVPHINTMQYIRDTYIECVYVPSKRKHILQPFCTIYLLAHNLF